MKEEVNRRVPIGAGSHSKMGLCLLLFLCLLSFTSPSKAQCLQDSDIFHDGEKVEFDLYFKWGLLMTKGGGATMTVTSSEYENQPVWKSELLLYSSGMIDKFFSIRDTIVNYTTQEKPRLLFSTKRSDEGGYYQIDNLTYSYKDAETHVHAFRRNKNRIKADTVLVGGNCVLDILGSLMYARSFDWHEMEQSKHYHLQVAMGKSVIPISYHYEGQQIVERENVKYATRYFIVDIYDDAFTQSKEALEIWIGDDDNHLPIKVRAKLKLGAMEAYYKDASGLRYPLNSRIVVPRKK
ncbi:DUF3108 domain-containing protein [Parabacteroides sp. PF5-6]|uniref:DUF3108 domain-containing protein n=1 Tax=Parabacteroides sp. PF5-6 TaxID=1742403 RepID=UPI002406E89C|nr:DUF3108 domain-containing protein [Parabacteroides sp. PF5-6]MDF9830500.1 hypothetical protein [Parabacteroides sp. PF5-6]